MQFQIPISSEIDLRADIVHLHRTYARMHACTPLHMVYGCRMVVGPCATLLVTRAQVYVRFSRWMAVDTMARRERRGGAATEREWDERSIFNDWRLYLGGMASNYITVSKGISINSQKRETSAVRSDYAAKRVTIASSLRSRVICKSGNKRYKQPGNSQYWINDNSKTPARSDDFRKKRSTCN